MSERDLAPDVTLSDLRRSLSDGANFVAQVRTVMFRTRRDRGHEVVVRLGRTGTGRAPNYKIEHADTGAFIAAYDGATHRTYEPMATTADGVSWSGRVSRQTEVEELLLDMRKVGR